MTVQAAGSVEGSTTVDAESPSRGYIWEVQAVQLKPPGRVAGLLGTLQAKSSESKFRDALAFLGVDFISFNYQGESAGDTPSNGGRTVTHSASPTPDAVSDASSMTASTQQNGFTDKAGAGWESFGASISYSQILRVEQTGSQLTMLYRTNKRKVYGGKDTRGHPFADLKLRLINEQEAAAFAERLAWAMGKYRIAIDWLTDRLPFFSAAQLISLSHITPPSSLSGAKETVLRCQLEWGAALQLPAAWSGALRFTVATPLGCGTAQVGAATVAGWVQHDEGRTIFSVPISILQREGSNESSMSSKGSDGRLDAAPALVGAPTMEARLVFSACQESGGQELLIASPTSPTGGHADLHAQPSITLPRWAMLCCMAAAVLVGMALQLQLSSQAPRGLLPVLLLLISPAIWIATSQRQMQRQTQHEQRAPPSAGCQIPVRLTLVEAEIVPVVAASSTSDASDDDSGEPGFVTEDIRQRFLVASSNDRALCEKRIKATLEWRRKLSIDGLLKQGHPGYPLETYHLAKAAFPHGLLGWAKSGHPVYFDAVKAQMKGFAALTAKDGPCTEEQLIYHCIFEQEYLWQVLDAGPSPAGQMLYLLDLKDLSIRDGATRATRYMLKMVAINQNHYPERLHRAFVFNAPSFVGAMWKMVEPLLGPGTKYKIRICTNMEEAKSAMLEEMDESMIPVEYGGTNATPLHQSELEMQVHAFVKRLQEAKK